ncbi:hypothetical protein HNY73_000429 [Argiope bruennichi]|uniref:Uncharacterized protein n=1 Tax=Argiope bruennichi TaxID=94029 RepID=A0A8T0FZ88_ARGBR|nr:hypothetical protein HNY73_000429 [Argiope bruennichi]
MFSVLLKTWNFISEAHIRNAAHKQAGQPGETAVQDFQLHNLRERQEDMQYYVHIKAAYEVIPKAGNAAHTFKGAILVEDN